MEQPSGQVGSVTTQLSSRVSALPLRPRFTLLSSQRVEIKTETEESFNDLEDSNIDLDEVRRRLAKSDIT